MEDMLKWTLNRRSEAEYFPKRRYSAINEKTAERQSSESPKEIRIRRKSLNALRTKLEQDKENLDTNFLRRSSGVTSDSPLQDISNGQSPNRTPRQRLVPRQFACTLPTYEAEDSPHYTDNSVYRSSPLRLQISPPKMSFNSSQVGDTTLDKMIDAIIESAKREFPGHKRRIADSMSDMDEEPSIHEMEVKTPDGCHLRRQKAVRRKNKSEPPNKFIGLTLPGGIPSPETPTQPSESLRAKLQDLASMETPESMTFIVDSFPGISTKDLQGCSTPTPSKTNSIKRCLHFSPDSDDESIEDKRKSVASSNSSLKNAFIKGSLDLAIFAENGKLNVHVIRCRDLQRPNGSSALNAYVKVALLPADIVMENGFQRTAVHRNSSRPYFDHRFKYDISDETQLEKRIQLAVWHRDRDLKRSEFLGCLSFPVRTVIKTDINGSYKLQSQSCLTNPQPPVLAAGNHSTAVQSTPSKTQTVAAANTSDTITSEMASLQQQRQDSVDEELLSIDSASAAALNLQTNGGGGGGSNTGQTIVLSKKAIHQRDADENLFLRFLELDPPPDDGTNGSGSGAQQHQSQLQQPPAQQQRRMSTFKPTLGRTPFTITKKLSRTADKGFGFSIVWTHPPRVEKIEPGLSADKNGIVPGDYVIFVDKHNVVTMPEADVLNLIRSQGNSLTLEIFRRSGTTNVPALSVTRASSAGSTCPIIVNPNVNGISKPRVTSAASNYTAEEMSPAIKQSIGLGPRSSTACSNASIETTKRRLHLPQVTFSKESIIPSHGIEDQRRRILIQVITREQNLVNALQFGMQRFATPLQERRDLISPNDHRTLFQNMDELIRISEDILEQLVQDDHETQLNFASRVYLSKTTAICAAYKKYCNGIKRADCVLVNKSRQPGSEFVAFITEPQVPRKRPDLTMFIHRPLQHFREILKLMQLLSSHCRVDSEEHKNFTSVINELQAAYREITVGGGLMEPLGEGRPLLTLQDLESRMVFTRCKPFTLAVQGRQWIFGGDLSRIEGRSIKPYWTLLFSDIIVFAKVSRDRVMFITEEPLPIVNIVDSCFNMRKKTTEFRITVDPNGRAAESPTAYCAPDLSRTPKKNLRRKSLILRAPSLELKAVWQNLLQRQIFLVNAALGSTPLSSPLDSPDFFGTLVPLSDIGATTTSMASIKLSSLDSINAKNQQNRSLNASQQIDLLIDEKCRILNKTGTPKGSALHLANWMKGQLDKQQEQARLAASEMQDMSDGQNDERTVEVAEEDERITFWTREQLEKRTKELNLAKENGNMRPMHPAFGGKRLSGVEELGISDAEDEIKSPSRSTTSDSQITVRSSPIANMIDKLSVCRHCHKNCKKKFSPSPPLLCNSLKVQHSQSSPNRCCQLVPMAPINGAASSECTTRKSPKAYDGSKSNSDTISTSASTITAPRLLSGSCSESDMASTTATPTTSITTVTTTSTANKKSTFMKNFEQCNCKCNPEDFTNTTLSPDEIHQETCKIIEDVSKIPSNSKDLHKNCKCVCKNRSKEAKKQNPSQILQDPQTDDDWSLVLIGLAQFTPAAQLVNSDAFVPTISVVPPTPDAILSKTSTNIWDNTATTATATKMTINHIPRQAIIENIPEDSPDESPQDEEPPYKSLNTGLRRYGTLSSLEKLPSEDGEEDDGEEEEEDDEDIEVITREVFSNGTHQPSLRNWTARAGSYVAEKMSFFEESRAFIDKYLGRWSQEQDDDDERVGMGDEEQLDECTSGATSGEEVWGTPTSGGDNDDMNMLNSDHTQSSPTKSSSSLNGDDDTELMMDELLMAPPMTASTIRGLLPRRRLEPLFEEESESEEEKTHQDDYDIVKKGETSSNGHDLKESIGNLRGDVTLTSMFPSRINPALKISQTILESNMTTSTLTTTMTMKTTILPTTTVNFAGQNINVSGSSTTSIVRRAKFSPPPPPPRRLLLTQSDLETVQPQQGKLPANSMEQIRANGEFGHTADDCSSVGVQKVPRNTPVENIANRFSNTNKPRAIQQKVGGDIKSCVESIDHADSNTNRQPATNETIESQTATSSPVLTSTSTTTSTTPSQSPTQKASAPASGLSPRLEMRLALNHDILGDEDLISYEPGPDLTTILGHDLSTFHRLTGRDLLNRSANRIQPKETVISYSQQRNSKKDTPTLNRKLQHQQLQQQQNQNIWNNSAYVDRIERNDINVVSCRNNNSNSGGSKLSDLELLAKREKIYCTSQLKSGSPARTTITITPTGTPITTRSTSSMESVTRNNVLGIKDSNTRTSRFFNFLTRRNSENRLSNDSRDSLNSSNASSMPDRRVLSPRKDNDKPPLNRRFWKQITKRRRSHSVSEIVAS